MTARGLVHPLPLASVALLLLNDHVLKRACPSWLTGKLSDFAGLFFFPVLLVAVAEVWPALARRRAIVSAFACAAVAVVFAAIKVSPTANALASHVGTFVRDPTDLVALVSVGAAWVFLDRPVGGAGVRRWQTGLAIVVASGASVATSRPPTEPKYPMWTIGDGGPQDLGCARIEAWVPKSGRTGFGVAMAVDAPQGCVATLSAAFRAGDVGATSGRVTIEGGERRWVYLPLSFDNLALFDRDVEDGEITLTLDDGRVATRVLHARQRRVAPFGRARVGEWIPLAIVGPTTVTTSCGPVHVRAEREHARTLVLFTAAPRCGVELTGTVFAKRRDATKGVVEDLEQQTVRVSTHDEPSGEPADLWTTLGRGTFGKLELEIVDGGRRIPWVFEVDERSEIAPAVVTP